MFILARMNNRLIALLLVLFCFSLEAIAEEEPILNYSSTQCAPIDFKHFKPINADSLESIYCGYKMGLRSSGNYLYLTPGNFSTQEITEGNLMWRRAALLKSCEENQLQTLSLLKRNYPSVSINCDKYKNFDDGTFEKNISLILGSVPPKDIANNSEIIVISGYRARSEPTSGAQVKVFIDRPNSKVLLILSSYDEVNWQISSSASTEIVAILASRANDQPATPVVSTNIKTQVFSMDLPHPYETDSSSFVSLQNILNDRYSLRKIDSLRMSYYIPSPIKISSLDSPKKELTSHSPDTNPPSKNFHFSLLGNNFSKSDWTLTGPVKNESNSNFPNEYMARTISGDRNYWFAGSKLNYFTKAGGAFVSTEPPANFPKISWGSGLAFDTKRKIVTVVSYGGEGYLYRFDTTSQQWIDFKSMKNIDIQEIVYDPIKDQYLGWTIEGSLVQLSNEGVILNTKKNVIQLLTDYGRLYGNRELPLRRLRLAPNGDDIAMIGISRGQVKSIWHYNFVNDKAELTYWLK